MNASDPRQRIGGLGRAITDIAITVPTQIAEELLSQHGFFINAVHLIEARNTLLMLAQELGKHGITTIAPGDPVSNSLHMMGICQQSRAAPFALHWFGSVGRKDPGSPFSIDPLDSMRRVSILTHCIAAQNQPNFALCVISQETKRVIAIVAQRDQGVMSHSDDLPVMDMYVALLLDLLRASPAVLKHFSLSGAFAVILGDTVTDNPNSLPLLTELARSEKLKWIIGRFHDVEKLTLVRSDKVSPPFQNVEIVGTRGPSPVKIWDTKLQQLLAYAVPPVGDFKGNELGAGDAYAGGYLYGRLSQHPIVDSHLFASACAKSVLQSDSARAESENDLNVIFGRLIERSSESKCEGALFERVRLSPNLTIVSPGQKGVDQIAIRAATALGLPCFCVLPQGRRTEPLKDEIDYFGESHIKELASSSYRFRSWAAAFIADGTLLWDFYGSEGSASTRTACHTLGRPFLDMTTVYPDIASETVARWVDRYGIRVINIAGSRASLLTREHAVQAELQIKRLLRFLAFRLANPARPFSELPVDERGEASNGAQLRDNLRIGVPNSVGQRALFESFLQEVYGLSPSAPRNLYIKSYNPAFEIVFARPRDLPIMLREKAIDVVLCGGDVLYDQQMPLEILLDTGLFQCFIVLVGKDRKGEVECKQTLRIGSQYPRLASELLSHTNTPTSLRVIEGTAEAWIKIGLVDAAIDTWQTGSAADANNLHLHHIFMCTSLVVATSPSENNACKESMRRLVNELGLWLAGKAPLS